MRVETSAKRFNVHDSVVVYPDVTIEEGVTIFPGAVIGRPPRIAGTVHETPVVNTYTYIGMGTVIGANAVIYQGVQTGTSVLIGDGATIRENCQLHDQSIVGNNCTFQNGVILGARSRVIDLSHITAHVSIGEDSFLSTGVLTMNDNSFARGGELKAPYIGHRVRIGGGAILLPGVHVRNDATVAAGSVVTHDVEEGDLVKGIPARSVRDMIVEKKPMEPQPGEVDWNNPDELWRLYYFGNTD